MKLSVLSVLSLFFSEKLFMQMADRIAEDGFKNAGYQYVCIDVSMLRKCSWLLQFHLPAINS